MLGRTLQNLRKLIREMISEYLDYASSSSAIGSHGPGAGIVVVRNFADGWKVLILKTGRGFDLPKGGSDPGEPYLETALRETYEETGIYDIEFSWGTTFIPLDNLRFYLARTEQDAIIRANPETGEFEHISAVWTDWDSATENIYPYLVPAITWAKQKVEQPTRIQL